MIRKELKIIVCGGHFTPAYALIEELMLRKKYRIFFIGVRKTSAGYGHSSSAEYTTITSLGIPFYPITAGKLPRYFTFGIIDSLIKIPIGLIQSMCYLLRVKPDLVISFGGYIALHVSVAAWIIGIPIITHEQTTVMGLTNRLISFFSKRTCLSFPGTKRVKYNDKTVIIGNLIRRTLSSPRISKKIISFGDKSLPLILVTGGNQGSRSINQAVMELYPELLCRFRIIHQCGAADDFADYQILSKLLKTFPGNISGNCQIEPFIEVADFGYIIKNAELIIGRAGGNTVYELGLNNKKSILIPLPWSGGSEQLENAKMLEKFGNTIILEQFRLNHKSLLDAIRNLADKKTVDYRKSERKKLFTQEGVKKFIDIIEDTCNYHVQTD